MKNATTLLASGLLLAASAAAAFAVTVDGTYDGTYGAPNSVQTTQTQFGDSNLGVVDYANGSELDAAFARVEGGVLYMLFTGNLESNFNKLELYFDTQGGGQNQLRGDNPDVDFNGLNRQAGLKFDSSFSPDFYVTTTGGYDGSGYRMFAGFAELLTGGSGAGYYLGSNTAVTPGPLAGGTNPFGIQITINNSTTGGVGGGCDAASGADTRNGVEVAIPLAAIGSPAGCLKVSAFINGSSHDYLSNQVLGPLPAGTCNLGEPANVDFNQYAGNQYFTVCDVSTPTTKTTWGHVKTLYR
jgi:hypothetical protein